MAARRTIGIDAKTGNVVGDRLARRTIGVYAKAWNLIRLAEASCWHENPWETGHSWWSLQGEWMSAIRKPHTTLCKVRWLFQFANNYSLY
jgi:hypothetical protein